MGRSEKPLDPADGPVQRFAQALRLLRQEAGGPTYRDMAREVEYSSAALSRAASGDTLPSLAVALAYVTACGADPAGWEERWREASRQEAGQVWADDENAVPPFRGLARYEPDDADRFFGRDRLTDELVRTALDHRVTVVLGPSGSGKSSLLRAGLIPRLRALDEPGVQPAAVRILTPGPHPVRDHERLFVPDGVAGDTWLIVDQFEEVFTLCHDPEERNRFIALLSRARDPESRLRVVLGTRADFYSHCLEHPDLAAVVHEASLPVRPLTPAELREVILKSTAAEGLIVERSLTARVLEEATAEPGSLPLLSHALLETWRRRRGRTLSLQAYELAGGLRGAITQSAEHAYAQLPDGQAQVARQLLLRLITPGAGTPDTRRPAAREELDAVHPVYAGPVLEHLARARLVALDRRSVDLTHEALITAWPRLRQWIERDRDRLRAHRQLAEAAQDWHDLGRDADALLRGTRLAQAQSAFGTEDRRIQLTTLEEAFLTASQHAHRRTRLTRRAIASALSVLVVLALVASGIAWQQGRARDQQRRESAARSAATLAQSYLQSDPQTAMRLSLAAWRLAHVPEARAAVVAVASHPDQDTDVDADPDSDSDAPRFLDRYGRTVATFAGRNAVRRDVDTHRVLSSDPLIGEGADVSEDGRTMLLTGGAGTRLWHTGQSQRDGPELPGSVLTVGSFQGDGRALVLTDSYDTPSIQVWDVADQRLLFKNTAEHPLDTHRTAVSSDERLLATCAAGASLEVWDMAAKRTLALPRSLGAYARCPGSGDVHRMRFTPDGKGLTLMNNTGVRTWNLTTGRQELVVEQQGLKEVRFSDDGRLLAAATGNEILMWRTADPARPVFRYRLVDEKASSLRLDVERGLLRFVGGRKKGAVRSLDVRGVVRATAVKDPVESAVFSQDTRLLATSVRHGTLRAFQLRDGESGKVITELSSQPCPAHNEFCAGRMAFSADGRTLAYGVMTWEQPLPRQEITLYDVTKRRTKAVMNLTSFGKPRQTTLDIALDPSGRTLLAIRLTGEDRVLESWNTQDGKLAKVADGPGYSFMFPPTKNQATTLGGYVTDLTTGRTSLHHPHSPDLLSLAASGGGLMAAGTRYPEITVWDENPRRHMKPFSVTADDSQPMPGERTSITALALSRDGHVLAAAGSDGSLQLWDTQTQRPLSAALATGGDVVRTLAFSPDGRFLYASGERTPSRSYPLAAQALSVDLCHRVQRDFSREEWRKLIPEASYRKVC
ncbi:nSTAND1 domain-containing NTPase [Streptomyces melanogenes]|uniref:WD40 repeat domain-containing protein n=1 Tax=Streptomyces melanogenes TaxID=67326 RepID=UPI003787CDBA